MLKSSSRALAIGSLLIPAILAGCGGSDLLTVYPTTGTLTMGDEPFGPTLIHLVPTTKEGGRMVVGEVDEQGKTTFTTYKRGDGAPAGQYRVLVAMKMEAPPRPFPEVYRDSEKSPLTVTVEETEENNLTMEIDPKAGPLVGKQDAAAAERMSAAQGDLMKAKPVEEE